MRLLTSFDYYGSKTPVLFNLMDSSDHVRKIICYVSDMRSGYHATMVATISAEAASVIPIIEP
jgi:hypothetical protein